MKRHLLLILVLISSAAFSQTVISGRVTDHRGDPIPMANVQLLNTYDGASADLQGVFEFSTDESGEHTILVSVIGFKPFSQKISLGGQQVKLNVILEEQINELDAVVISAGSFTASDEARRTVFKALDIATTAGATADIAGALNTLPGTQKVGESGRLFVRGGDGNEARTFIDGLLVLDAYGPAAPNTPSRGRFLPFMFKGTSFSTGGYSSEYGQALSSALVLDSKDESEMTRTDIGIMSVGADVAHTQAWETGSAAAKIQYTNIRPYFGMINQEIDWVNAPRSMEATTAFRQKTRSGGIVKFFGNINNSDLSFRKHDIDDNQKVALTTLRNDFMYANAAYKQPLGEKWLIRGGLAYTDIVNKLGQDTLSVNASETGLHAKAVLEGSLNEKLELRTGAEVLNRGYQYVSPLAFDETITAVFAESDAYASNRFVTRAGVRVEYNSLQKVSSADPRISLAYKTGTDGQMSLAFGRFRQSAGNDYLRVSTTLQSEKAEHLILNYQRITNNRTFRVETYYKRYTDLVKLSHGSSITNDGNGYARGVELFWRDNNSLENTDYWISYSFLDTKRDYLNFPKAATPGFASKHNLSMVYKYFFTKIRSQVGLTYSFASGRPYHNPNSTGFHNAKTPAYHDLSMNFSYLPKPYIILHVSCTNLPGRDNIFGYEYSSIRNEDGSFNAKPIRQAAPRFLFLGIFITLSKEKSMNQLPAL